MGSKAAIRLTCILVLAALVVPLAAFNLKTPQVFLKDDQLYTSLETDHIIPYRVLSAIEDGIKIRFIYEVRLRRKIGFFLASDPVLVKKNVFYTINLNFLEGRYLVTNSVDGKTRFYRTRTGLLKAITRWEYLPLLPFASLKEDRIYYLEVRARIRSIKMYPPFSFLSILSHDTQWKRSGDISK